MAKINIKAVLITEDEKFDIETYAIKKDNKITYKENDISVTINIFNNKIEMKRVCKDYEINLIFEYKNKTISTYKVFGAPKVFELETNTKKLDIENDKIIIEYILEGNHFSYTLKMGG